MIDSAHNAGGVVVSLLVSCLALAGQEMRGQASSNTSPTAEIIDVVEQIPGLEVRYWHLDCAEPEDCVVSGEYFGEREGSWSTITFIRRLSGEQGWKWVKLDSLDTPDELLNRYYLNRVAHPTPDLILVSRNDGFLLRSIDGGESWVESRPLEESWGLEGLHMIDGEHGVAKMNHWPIYTSDGGISWVRVPLPDSLLPDSNAIGGMNNVRLASTSRIVISARAHGRYGYPVIAVTEDFGVNWIVTKSLPSMGRFIFVNESTGWAGGAVPDTTQGSQAVNDLIMHTSDGGVSWVEQLNRRIDPPYGIAYVDFADLNHGVAAGGQGKLLVTQDGGETWDNLSMDPDSVSGFWGVSFPKGEHAYLAGGNGTIVRVDFATSSVAERREESSGWSVGLRGQVLFIQSETTGEFSFYLSSVLGECIAHGTGMGDEVSIDIGELSAGIYFLHLEGPEARSSYPIRLMP